jgi:hypothetical protein
MSAAMMIIDPPSPFAPVREWTEFLAEMEALVAAGKGDEIISDYVETAKAEVSRRQN